MDMTFSVSRKFKGMLVNVLSIFVMLAVALANTGSRVQAQQSTELCYVKSDAIGSNDGTSWADAYTDLQSALGSSTCTEVWVAAGTYKPGTARDDSFTLKDGVALFGGFAGTETQLTERDPAANLTILSGDIGTLDSNSDNSYHVVNGGGTNSSAGMDGFIITSGNANVFPHDSGGGMYNENSNPSLTNVTFSSNSAATGGGMFNWNSNPSLTNVLFIDNSANLGGGIFNNYYSNPNLTNVTFTQNSATGDDGSSGGGMFNHYSSNPTLTNVIFSSNSAYYGGGGMYSSGSNASLTNVTFSNNSANYGGGMYNYYYSSPSLINVTFSGNSAILYSGGMYNNYYSNPSLTNVTFSDNSASVGGGMRNESNSNPNLVNVTFSGNSSTTGAGMFNVSSNPTIRNSILYNDSGGEIFNDSSTPVITFSIIQGGYPGTGNLDADPLLGVLQDNGGFTQTMALGSGSSAIDAGDNSNCPSTDQRGEPRPIDGDGDGNAVCDIGAFEAGEAAPLPNPHFTVFPEAEWFDGADWPDGATVNITVEGKPECTTSKESWNHFFNGNFPEGCDVAIGDTVTFTDGQTVRTHTVQNLAIKSVEIRTDTIYGTASPGAVVHVWVHEHGESEMAVTAEGGNWMAEFWRIGFNLVEGMCGRSEIRDDVGNATAVDWCYPVPHFTVFPEQDVIEGFDWHPNDYVYLTIEPGSSDEPVNFYTQARTERTPWDPNRWWVRFDLAGQFDLRPGDTVLLDDDSVTRTMTVANLSVMNVDPLANIVGGTARPGAEVQVWPHESGQQLEATVDDSGIWQVDFTDVFDLVPGTCGRSQILDTFDNATAMDWCAPKPWLTAFPENDAVEGWEWPNGATVTLTIDNAPGLEWSGTAAVTTWGDPRTFVRIEFGKDYNLQIGDKVTLTDEFGTARTHTVQNLAITKASAEDNVIKGIADAGAEVHVWPHATGQEQVAITNPNNKWSVDFSGVYDLIPGEAGRSEIRDEFGNATAVDWYIPKPHFTVFPEAEWFDGMDWPDGKTVVITVAGKPECKVKKESWGYFFNGNFPEGCDVVTGDSVTFTDDTTTLTHIVRYLKITNVDKNTDIATGVADIGATVYVWAWEGGPQIELTVEDGTWQVDFGALGIDLKEGSAVRAEIRDELGNATSMDWWIPNPHFEVRPEADSVAGWEWQPNSQVSISIAGNFITTAQTDESGYFGTVVSEQLDIVPGMNVEVTDGISAKTHLVSNLSITGVDVDTDIVAGISTPNHRIQAEVCVPDGCIDRWEMADGIGNWSADFRVPGDEPGEERTFDFIPGSSLDSREWDDDGDNTITGYHIPNPRFTIFPLWQWYDGLDWPDGASVNITVENKPACSLTKTSQNYFFNGGLPQGCYVEIGDTITFTDGTTTRTHVVRNLAITAIDLNKDTISGKADAGTMVYVWPHDGWFEPLQAIANNSGVWQVDFSDVGYDIRQGASGRAEIRDDIGNATAVDWNLNPRIVVQITNDWFRAENFQPNTSLNFWIYDAPGGKRLLKSVTAKTDSGGTITHWVGDQLDLVPGNYLVVSDGKTKREIVLEALTFDLFDTSVGILEGTAPEPFGRKISVGIGCWQRDDLGMDTTTDENGAWIVDFGAPVPNDFGCVYAWAYDEDGDVSEVRPSQIIWSE